MIGSLSFEERLTGNQKTCDGCGAECVWVKTHYGRWLLVDRERITKDNREVMLEPDGENIAVTPAVPRHKCKTEKV